MTHWTNFGIFAPDGAGVVSQYADVYDQFVNKPSGADSTAFNTFVKSLVDAGVWDDGDRLFLANGYVGANTQDHLIDWLHPSTNSATLVNAPTVTAAQGIQGDGATQYIDLNFAFSSLTNYQQDDGCVIVYSRSDLRGSAYYDVGENIGVPGTTRLNSNAGSGSNNIVGILNTGSSISHGPDDALGMTAIARFSTSGSIQRLFRNGVEIDFSTANSTGVPNQGCFALGCYGSGGTLSIPSPRQISMIFVGSGMNAAKHLALYNAYQTLMTHLGTQV